jgi:hypothetical protein
MPTLRLYEVRLENPDQVANLPPNLKKIFDDLANINAPLTKLDDKTVLDLRAIAEALKISVFDLFAPNENLYRLKIFEVIENRYSGTLKEKLESLRSDLPESRKVSLALLGIYATQILPENLLKGLDLKEICKTLGVNLEDLKEISNPPRQTISVESILKKLGVTLDELSVLLDVPKKFIPWISIDLQKLATIEPSSRFRIERRSESANWFKGIEEENGIFIASEYGCSDFCSLCTWVCCCRK